MKGSTHRLHLCSVVACLFFVGVLLRTCPYRPCKAGSHDGSTVTKRILGQAKRGGKLAKIVERKRMANTTTRKGGKRCKDKRRESRESLPLALQKKESIVVHPARLEVIRAKRKLFILAAVGNNEGRLKRALELRATFPADWDCLILSYEEVSNKSRFNSCQLLNHPGQWGSIVHNLVRNVTTDHYDYVALLLDDLITSVSPNALVDTLRRYKGSVISPGIYGNHHNNMCKNCLYETPFMEIFHLIFTGSAWKCFASLFGAFEASDSRISGWGFDVCLQSYCGYRMLYDNRIVVQHADQKSSAKGRRRGGTKGVADRDRLNAFVLKNTGRECIKQEDLYLFQYEKATCLQ